MIELQSPLIRLSVLDPVEDRSRLGPRFCTGGYVYQTEHATLGPLLSGPEFPSDHPSAINGQGLPEVFQFTLFDKDDDVPEKKLIIGVGLVDNSSGGTSRDPHLQSPVEEFCRWEITRDARRILMETVQNYGKWSLSLARDIRLNNDCLTSATRLRNIGQEDLPFRWFAHPFFPLTRNLACCKFPDGFEISPNPGFRIDDQGILAMQEDYPWSKGFFEIVSGVEGSRFSALQYHPKAPGIRVWGDFPLSKLAIWANDRTFSFEPFCAGRLKTNEETHWAITYEFTGETA
jgi:hypothetical protein